MKTAIIVLQGMGKPNEAFYEKLEKNIRKYLTPPANGHIAFFPVDYQASFQDAQTRLWERIVASNKRNIRQKGIRRFLLDYFSDAVTYEFDKESSDGVYQKVHSEIYSVLKNAASYCGNDGRLIIITYSLGCQVFSNYVWDLQKSMNGDLQGIWKNEPLPHNDFLKLKTLRCWFSCGCNIPLFVSGLDKIEAIRKPTTDFEWLNYFDRSDVLGWPLKALSKTGENGVISGYNELVQDVPINIGWWIMSHVKYWRRRAFVKRVAQIINNLF
jgi:hypothetical protein